ncbi:MAG: polyhydroxyalkanoate synthesis repressor PhaR [Proteobacteria bacterium]|nr:polyhydroxyalkanoate synthesis repressor PhaR [Pseudomonadota bacterium]
MPNAKPAHVIKKYANRRLYHTGTSAYVTLEDLAAMVKAGEDFVVNDAKSGEDITHSVLTQIIFEQESKGQNLLPVNFLRQMIRFYGDSMQGLVPRYLELSMDRLIQEQQSFREQMTKTFGGFPLGRMDDQVRANMAAFTEAFRMFSPFAGKTADPVAAKAAPVEDDEVSALKRELGAMKARLDKLDKR